MSLILSYSECVYLFLLRTERPFRFSSRPNPQTFGPSQGVLSDISKRAHIRTTGAQNFTVRPPKHLLISR